MKNKKVLIRLLLSGLFFLTAYLFFPVVSFALEQQNPGLEALQEQEDISEKYLEYTVRLEGIGTESEIRASGFQILGDQVFPLNMERFGEVTLIPARDKTYGRLAFFFVAENGTIVYRTEQFETNNRNKGQMEQPNKGILAISFQDMNEDGLTDIVMITACSLENGKIYKVGDVLFQNEDGFYRDWRLSDKINRFSMNKSIEFIVAFVRDGYSTEFLYTASTLEELLGGGFQVTKNQSYWRDFEKLGRLQVVPGTYNMAEFHIFMIYLVNEQGYIVWSLQPTGEYDDLYALKGIVCKDIDGDGMKDMLVLARCSYEDEKGKNVIVSDYAIYYQRTSGFYADTDFKKSYICSDEDTANELVEKAREFWGWRAES